MKIRTELKKISKSFQSEFDHRFACWAINHNGWSKQKKLNRKIAKKKFRRVLNKELQEELIND